MTLARTLRVVLPVFLCLASVQTVLGQVSGTVVDDTMTPVEDALVSIQPSLGVTPFRTTTDATGAYSFSAAEAPPGSTLVIVGAKKTFFNIAVSATAPMTGVTIQLQTVPIQFDTSYEMDAFFCSFCHDDQFTQWSESRMGKTGSNTWVYDLYAGTGTPGGMGGFVYVNDSVQMGTNPDGDCAACHQPVRWVRQGPQVALAPDPMNDSDALASVSCDVCHKIADVDTDFLTTKGIDPLAITLNLPGPGPIPPQVQYGVLADVDFFDTNFMRSSYQPQLTHDACGACHEYENVNGVTGQNTWSTWANSPYGDPMDPSYATCVDCHSQGFGATEACGLIDLDRDPESVHEMGMVGSTPEFLENAVELSLTAAQMGSSINVQVEIENTSTGHSFPTGIAIRNVLLVIDAIRQEDGLRLTETIGMTTLGDLAGVGDPDNGDYAGLPGKIYARVLTDAMGNDGVIFTEAVSQTDTTISPFASDTTSYSFEVPMTQGMIDITARLIYRRAWRPTMLSKGWDIPVDHDSDPMTPDIPVDGQNNLLQDAIGPHFGHLMETASETIDTGPFMGGDPEFQRGDADGDGNFNGVLDGLRILNFQFIPGSPAPPCMDAADFDDDGVFNGILDGLGVLNFQFIPGSMPPAPPGLMCGTDPTPDALDCAEYLPCP